MVRNNLTQDIGKYEDLIDEYIDFEGEWQECQEDLIMPGQITIMVDDADKLIELLEFIKAVKKLDIKVKIKI